MVNTLKLRTAILCSSLTVAGCWSSNVAADEVRKPVFNPAPTYPEMAKRMQLVGVVKIELTIASDGRIKEAKVIGGHPVLVDAAIVALRDWKYECGNSETKTQVEFKFHF